MVDIILNRRVRIAAITAFPAFDGMTEELQVDCIFTPWVKSMPSACCCRKRGKRAE